MRVAGFTGSAYEDLLTLQYLQVKPTRAILHAGLFLLLFSLCVTCRCTHFYRLDNIIFYPFSPCRGSPMDKGRPQRESSDRGLTPASLLRKMQVNHTRGRMKSTLLAASTITLLATGCAVTINNPTASNPPSGKQPAAQAPAAPSATSGLPSPQAEPTTYDIATVYQVSESTPPGLKIVNAELVYNDGDVLTGDFRVYCPTSMIRPTNYILKNSQGALKKQGSWWEPAFQPKWEAERSLVRQAC